MNSNNNIARKYSKINFNLKSPPTEGIDNTKYNFAITPGICSLAVISIVSSITVYTRLQYSSDALTSSCHTTTDASIPVVACYSDYNYWCCRPSYAANLPRCSRIKPAAQVTYESMKTLHARDVRA